VRFCENTRIAVVACAQVDGRTLTKYCRTVSQRPPFIISSTDVPETEERYPQSDELLILNRAIGKHAGMLRLGLHLCRVPPGHRTSYPHAEENEEEFVYVLEGNVDAWIDGELHPMKPGDLAAFPAGTGISHTFLNNGSEDALLLVGGEAGRRENKIYYPLNPERRAQIAWSQWWDDHERPQRKLGSHDGKPKKR
jgi:uncharacterized cupin superfamily protein